MSIEQAVHQHWSTTFALTSLVPANSTFTGAAYGDPLLPYVVIDRQGNTPLLRTSSGRVVEETVLRFHVWTDSLEQGKEIAGEVARSFDGARLPVRRGSCLGARQVADNETLEDDGTWHLTMDYSFTLEHTRGG